MQCGTFSFKPPQCACMRGGGGVLARKCGWRANADTVFLNHLPLYLLQGLPLNTVEAHRPACPGNSVSPFHMLRLQAVTSCAWLLCGLGTHTAVFMFTRDFPTAPSLQSQSSLFSFHLNHFRVNYKHCFSAFFPLDGVLLNYLG